jgi:hypothetical protein
MFSGTVPWSIYDPVTISETFTSSRVDNQTRFYSTLESVVLNYSPLLWVATSRALAFAKIDRTTRSVLTLLFAVQCGLVLLFLPYHPRFLGGFQYGLVVVFAGTGNKVFSEKFLASKVPGGVAALLLLPWLALQFYYARPFLAVGLHAEPLDSFYRRYLAFLGDFQSLNRVLPTNAVLLVSGFRIDAVYAPRPVFFDARDLPENRPAFLLAPQESLARLGKRYGTLTASDRIYENPHAVSETYRTPGRTPQVESLGVARLEKRE